MAAAHLGEIFIGDAIDEWSERRALAQIHIALTATGEPFILLANFQLGGRQIDSVVITTRHVVVVEVKASRLPVRGGLDGDWQRLHVSGEWRRYTNGYQQALGQKNSLRDAMRESADVAGFYPDAAVVFATPLSNGSALTNGDFKVVVTDLRRFDPTASGKKQNPWTLDDWRAFATRRSLRTATLAEVMGGQSLAPAFAVMRDYRDRIASELARDGEGWLPESEEQRATLLAALDEAPGTFIKGPSGCGKTLAARWLGSQAVRAGQCVLYLAAKDFDGSWSRLLKRELALVIDVRAAAIFKAIGATGTPVLIVLDGINELGSARDAALRGLRAIARQLDARVIVTGQAAVPSQLSGLKEIAIRAPTLALKERIAKAHLGSLGMNLGALLNAVVSGFEATIVAEIGASVSADASRQLLVEQFIRYRLGNAQRSGSAGLRLLAQTLIESTSFSINETAFDELLAAKGVGHAEIDAIFAANLLVRRGGRVSFAHEILLNACAAFGYAQFAATAGEKFSLLLALPALEAIAADIVSVIEDPAVVKTVLETTSDSSLLYDAARGLAGPIAAQVADNLLTQTESEIGAEIVGLRLMLVAGDNPSVDWEDGSVRLRSAPEEARINALAREVGTGHRMERFFDLCASMDAVLLEERRRLSDAATAAGITALKSNAFGLAYSGFGKQSGLAQISQMAGSGVFDIVGPALRNTPHDMMRLTSGQLHFYLERRRLFLDHVDVDDVADGLARLVIERFRWEPAQVKLAILHTATFVRQASPARLSALIEAIETIDANREGIWISTAVIDALKFLGGLEDSAERAREGIRDEFERATGPNEDEFILGLALTVAVAMFDHPYDHIYGDEFEALTPEKRRLLLRRAARCEDARKCLNLSWVIREIASFDDPIDGVIMQEFARLPHPQNVFPQEEWSAFIVATRFLGHHQLALPTQDGHTNTQHALILLRALLHATSGGVEREPPAQIWVTLNRLPPGVVMGCFSELEQSLIEHHWSEPPATPRPSLLRAYTPQWLAVARRFLDEGGEPQHFRFAHARDSAPGYAFQILETFGDRSDVARLRRLADDPRHARRALEALRRLDSA